SNFITFGNGGSLFGPAPAGQQQALVSAQVNLFAPATPMTCACGLGAGASGTPAPTSLNASNAVVTRYNTQTGQHTILTEFTPLSLNSLTSQGLAMGPGQLFPGAQWFGFSGQIQPFTAPALGPNEIFTLTFALNFDPDDRDALVELPLQFAAGVGDQQGFPIFDPRDPHPVMYFGPSELPSCLPTQNALCLNKGRFMVDVDWRISSGATGKGIVAPCAARDSGNLAFFGPDNIEMLIKVLDACTLNNRYWVFYSATTNVEFTLTVTDTRVPRLKMYRNPLGNPAPPVQDTSAFATCP
ncbi:MAG: hypothetical protein ACRD2T_05945, partial [Thermoanaerobaculia bacterium]